MFNFRIIDTADGNQIIDENLTTLDDDIDIVTMLEYIEVENAIYAMNRQNRKKEREINKKNKLYHKLTIVCGLFKSFHF